MEVFHSFRLGNRAPGLTDCLYINIDQDQYHSEFINRMDLPPQCLKDDSNPSLRIVMRREGSAALNFGGLRFNKLGLWKSEFNKSTNGTVCKNFHKKSTNPLIARNFCGIPHSTNQHSLIEKHLTSL
jgi:hypothetical protein